MSPRGKTERDVPEAEGTERRHRQIPTPFLSPPPPTPPPIYHCHVSPLYLSPPPSLAPPPTPPPIYHCHVSPLYLSPPPSLAPPPPRLHPHSTIAMLVLSTSPPLLSPPPTPPPFYHCHVHSIHRIIPPPPTVNRMYIIIMYKCAAEKMY